ncbi:MAG: DUF5312 family protein [Spirochaetaceae bacterium]
MDLFGRIVAIFTGGDDPEREKKRRLKQIGKNLRKMQQRFYKPRGQEALPALARFFYDIYKGVGPAQNLLANADSSAGLQAIVIERYMTQEQKERKDRFSEEEIRKEAEGTTDTKELGKKLKDDMVGFFSSFDGGTVKRINDTYTNLLGLIRLVKFDYYFVLRKFDSSIQENSFVGKPKFDSINAQYVSDDLKDFQEVALPLNQETDWQSVLDTLRDYKGVEVVNRQEWDKILRAIDDVRKSDVFTLIIRHVDEDPYYEPSVRLEKKRIVEPYLNKIKTTTEGTVQKLLNERKNRKIEQLKRKVFGDAVVARTKNYTEKANLVFSKRMLAGYTHTEAINFLKAFLLDYFKKDVREVVRDILLVRGRWASNMTSQQISEAFHEVLAISDQIVKFDDSLGEEGELGMKIKRAMGKVVDRDKTSVKLLKEELDKVNESARTMINTSAQNLITVAKILKSLLEDYDQKDGEMVLNWKELEGFTEEPLKNRMMAIYQRIYYFVQLLQVYVKSSSRPGKADQAGKAL